jgi:TetR/AcrR family transcriptional repressor of nem operon
MNIPSNKKRAAHERILTSAGRLFRLNGVAGAGVDSIMEGAGLTHGGFYAHFASKESLLAETIGQTIRQQTYQLLLKGIESLSGLAWLRAFTERYLSKTHRDSVAEGCAIPTLISELPRSGDLAKQAFETALTQLIDELKPKTPPLGKLESEDRLWATLALCVGGVALARSVKDPELSDRILSACQHLAAQEAFDKPEQE